MSKIKNKIKTGDTVIVLTGKNKGATGKVLQIMDHSVKVDGVNVAKRHTKPKSQEEPGGIILKVMPLSISNVALIDPKTNKPGKVGMKFLEDGKKVRYFKKTGEVIDV